MAGRLKTQLTVTKLTARRLAPGSHELSTHVCIVRTGAFTSETLLNGELLCSVFGLWLRLVCVLAVNLSVFGVEMIRPRDGLTSPKLMGFHKSMPRLCDRRGCMYLDRTPPPPPAPIAKDSVLWFFYFMYIFFSSNVFHFHFCLLLFFVLSAFRVLFYLGFVNNLFYF